MIYFLSIYFLFKAEDNTILQFTHILGKSTTFDSWEAVPNTKA